MVNLQHFARSISKAGLMGKIGLYKHRVSPMSSTSTSAAETDTSMRTATLTIDAHIQSVSDQREGWSWNQGAKTLTLRNVDITGDAAAVSGIRFVNFNKTVDTVTIELVGNNIVKAADGTNGSYGICADCTLVITGNGTLAAEGGVSSNGKSCGIISHDASIILSGGTIMAAGGSAANSDSVGIIAQNGHVSIRGGRVIAIGGNGNASCGIFGVGGVGVLSGALVTAMGGTAYRSSYGISANKHHINIANGALVYATATAIPGSHQAMNKEVAEPHLTRKIGSYNGLAVTYGAARNTTLDLTDTGSYYWDHNGNIELKTEVNFLVSDVTDSTEGWSWHRASKTLTLDGASIFVTDTRSAMFDGIMLPPGSTVILQGDNRIIAADNTWVDDPSYGVYGLGALAIQGTGSLNITSGSGTCDNHGIFCHGTLAIKGGAITVVGGTSGGNNSTSINSLYRRLRYGYSNARHWRKRQPYKGK